MSIEPTARFTVGPSDDPDKYSLRRMVGSGGEAQLWQADFVVAGNVVPVAVKILHPVHGDQFDQLTRRWSEQLELLRFVRNPGVVGVREHFVGAPMHGPGDTPDAGERPDLYLIMNWVEGRSLRDWSVLHRGPQATLEGIQFLEQIAAALDLLHSGRATNGRPIVHGDLSPGNVMIDVYGQAILVDFGLIQVASHRTSHPMGTPGFAAPETLRSGEYSPASDRYGFGALAYFTLTGAVPEGGPEQLMGGLRSVPLLADRHPAKLRDLISIFDPVPDRRPASAQQWVHLLRDTATTTVPPAQTVTPERTGGRSSSFSRGVTAAAVVLVAVLLVLLWRPWDGAPSGQAAPPTTVPTTQPAPTTTPATETSGATRAPTSRYEPKALTVALSSCALGPPHVDLAVPRTSSDGQSDFFYYGCGGREAIMYETSSVDVAVLENGTRPTAEACTAAIETSLRSDDDLVVRGGEVVCFRRTQTLVDREGVEPLIAAVTVDRVSAASLSVTAYAWNGGG